MKNDSLRLLINDTIKHADRGNLSGEEFTYNRILGATIGQVLFRDADDYLVVQRCWMALQVCYLPYEKEYVADLLPLCKVNAPHYFHTVLNEKLLKTLTGARHSFGGETVRFKHNAYPTLSRNESMAAIEQKIKAPENVLNIIPAVQQGVCECDGTLVIMNDTIFNIGTPKASFMDKYDCFIREYDSLAWVEPSNAKTDVDDWSEREALYNSSVHTNHRAIVVPTIWVKGDGIESECFLSFTGNWQQSKYGDRVSCKVGNFKVTHELQRRGIQSKGQLVTRTSLHQKDSVWQP